MEHIAFDELFVVYNRIRRDLDAKLKPLKLTLTSLQILMAIDAKKAHPQQCTRAAVAADVGITNSTASIIIGALIKRGLVVESATLYDRKRKPLALSTARPHQATYYKGLTVWDAVLEQWHDAIPEEKRKVCLGALKAAKATIDQTDAKAREEKYLKSLRRHSTRAIVLRSRGNIS